MKLFSSASVALLIVCAIACGQSRTRAPRPEPGAPCSPETSCVGGLLCVEDARLPGGMCTARCDAPCPPGSACVEELFGGLCFASCATDEECRDGYVCHRETCRPPCANAGECGEGFLCVDAACRSAECATWRECAPDERCADGRCVVVADGGGPAGDSCERDLDCASGICLPRALGGGCAEPCAHRADCAFDAVCIPFAAEREVVSVCVTADDSGRFLAGACAVGGDCESRTCVDSQCTETCASEDDCLPGQACVGRPFGIGTFRGCGYGPLTSDVDVVEVELGMLRLGAATLPRRINLALPNDAVSVTFTAATEAGDIVPLTFVDVFDPRNESLFSLSEIAMYHDQPVRFLPSNGEEIITMVVPGSTPDRVAFVPGRYAISIAMFPDGPDDTRSSDVRLTAWVKRARTIDRGSISLNVHLVGIGLTADEAPADARLANALSALGDIFGSVGISVASVSFFDVSTEDAARYQVIDSTDGVDSELAGLFRLGATREGSAVDLFLVRSFSGGRGTLGIAGGIPGPNRHGSMHSGVAIATDAAVVGSGGRGSRNIAQIGAHELSHYLGLYHVRERLDPCPPDTGPTAMMPCAPFGGGDVLSDTSLASGANLMWWALGGADGRTHNIELSNGQGFVMRRNVLVGP